MDWLKKLLENAEIKDGKIDIDTLMKSVKSEFVENAVSKEEYDNVKTQFDTATKTIKDLEKSNKDNEDLQTKIKNYEGQIENLKTEYNNKIRTMTVDSAINKALSGVDERYVELLNKSFDREKIIIKYFQTIEVMAWLII